MTLAKRRRQDKLPDRVLVSDETRLADVEAAAARLPAGTAVLLRHYGDPARAALAARLAGLCRRRRLILVVAGDWRLAAAVGAAGLHLPEGQGRHGILAPLLGWRRRRKCLLTMAAHSPGALARARRLGADAALLSPAFPTASHPGAPAIGPARFGLWAAGARLPVLALGGMNRRRRRELGPRAAGMAAVGAFGL